MVILFMAAKLSFLGIGNFYFLRERFKYCMSDGTQS